MTETTAFKTPAETWTARAPTLFCDVPGPDRSPHMVLRDLGLDVSLACDGSCFLELEDCP
jgi:hypothetical protein